MTPSMMSSLSQSTASMITASSLSGGPHVPCSTPVTPPNLDYLEKAFSKLNNNNSGTNLSGGANNTATEPSNSSNFLVSNLNSSTSSTSSTPNSVNISLVDVDYGGISGTASPNQSYQWVNRRLYFSKIPFRSLLIIRFVLKATANSNTNSSAMNNANFPRTMPMQIRTPPAMTSNASSASNNFNFTTSTTGKTYNFY